MWNKITTSSKFIFAIITLAVLDQVARGEMPRDANQTIVDLADRFLLAFGIYLYFEVYASDRKK